MEAIAGSGALAARELSSRVQRQTGCRRPTTGSLPLTPLGPDAVRELLDRPARHAILRVSAGPGRGHPRAYRRQPLLHRRGRARPRRVGAPRGRARSLSTAHADRAHRSSRVRPVRALGPDRPSARAREAGAPGRGRDRSRVLGADPAGGHRASRARASRGDGSPHCVGVSSTSRRSTPWPSTSSSTRSPSRSRSSRSSRSGARRTHARVARAIEAHHAAKLRRARGASRAPLGGSRRALVAARWNRRPRRVRRSDEVQGVRHMKRVLELTEELADSEERTRLRLDACRSLLMVGGWRIGAQRRGVEDLFAEGKRLASGPTTGTRPWRSRWGTRA